MQTNFGYKQLLQIDQNSGRSMSILESVLKTKEGPRT